MFFYSFHEILHTNLLTGSLFSKKYKYTLKCKRNGKHFKYQQKLNTCD